MVAWQNGQVVAVPLQEVMLQSPLPVDANGYLVPTARSLGIYVGDGFQFSQQSKSSCSENDKAFLTKKETC